MFQTLIKKPLTSAPALASAALALAVLASPAAADHLKIETEGVKAMDGALVFPMVKIDKPGFLVIHAVKDGNPVVPGSLGSAYVGAGTTGDVMVKLSEAPMMDATYIAMLHEDSGEKGVYEFGEGMTEVDPPALKGDGTPYAVPVKPGM